MLQVRMTQKRKTRVDFPEGYAVSYIPLEISHDQGGHMSEIQVTPWHKVTDEIVISWSVINLLHNISYELMGNATRTFSKTEALAQGSYGFTGKQQQDKIERLVPHITRVTHTAQQMMLWIDKQRGETTSTILSIPEAGSVLSWLPIEVVKNVYTKLQENVPPALETVSELRSGIHGFVDADQEKMIKLLDRDIRRTGEVSRCLAVWLEAHEKM